MATNGNYQSSNATIKNNEKKQGKGFLCFSCWGKERPPSSLIPDDISSAHIGNNEKDSLEKIENQPLLKDQPCAITESEIDNIKRCDTPCDNEANNYEICNPNASIQSPPDNDKVELGNSETQGYSINSITVTNTTSPSHMSLSQAPTNTISSQLSSHRYPSTGLSSPPPPLKCAFLVSFMVDARGGAMTGNRASGLRMIIPQGAVDSPVRVTCRYIRSGSNDRQLLYPPPLMEREALASRVIEMGPPAASFKSPVLLEVPHFASLRDGERELIVLRSDDGETWQEHTMAYFSSWCNGNNQEGEIYEDFIATTGINAAYEELDTHRVVRISTQVFPKYFAILSRIKEEVRVIGADGGKIEISHTPHLQVYFPSGALQKRIKVALQIQKVPNTMLSLICPSTDGNLLHLSPLVALEPRRRRFHSPVQVMVPLPRKESNKIRRRIRLLCSLTGNTSKANWEDVTDATSFVVKSDDRLVIFETKVSALFWALAIDDEPSKIKKAEKQSKSEKNKLEHQYESADPDYEDVELASEAHKDVLRQASRIYDELILSPYMARILVLHRPHTPHAWCDSIRIYCVTDDKAELTFDAKQQGDTTSITTKSVKSATVGGEEWRLLAQSDELEVSATSILRMDLSGGNIEIADDCQIEFGYRQTLRFQPFQNNSCTLLVKPIDPDKAKFAKLEIRRSFDSKDSKKIVSPLCTLDLNLDPFADRRSESPSMTLENRSLSWDEKNSISIEVSSNPKTLTSLTSHVVAWNQEETLTKIDEIEDNRMGHVKYTNENSQRPSGLDLIISPCYQEQNGNNKEESNTSTGHENINTNNVVRDIAINVEIPSDEIYENVPVISSKVQDDDLHNDKTSLHNSSSKGSIAKCSDDMIDAVVIEENGSSCASHENVSNYNVNIEERNFENQSIQENDINENDHPSYVKNTSLEEITPEELTIDEEYIHSSSNAIQSSPYTLLPNVSAKEDQKKVEDAVIDFQTDSHEFAVYSETFPVEDEINIHFNVSENEDSIANGNQNEAEKLLMKEVFVKSLVDSCDTKVNENEHDENDRNIIPSSNNESFTSKDRDISLEENTLNSIDLEEERRHIANQIEVIPKELGPNLEPRGDDKIYTTISEVESALLMEDNVNLLGSERTKLHDEEKPFINDADLKEESEVISKFLNSDNIVREVNHFEKSHVGYFDDSIIQGQTEIVLKDDLGFRKSISMEKVDDIDKDKNKQQEYKCDNSSVEVLIESSSISLNNQNGSSDNEEINELRHQDPGITCEKSYDEVDFKSRSHGDSLVDNVNPKSSLNAQEDENSTNKKLKSLVDDATEIATIVAISDEIMSHSKSPSQ